MKKIFTQALLMSTICIGTFSSIQAETPINAPVTQHSDVTANLQPYTANYYATFDRFSGRNTSTLSQNAETGEYTYYSKTKPRGIAALAGKIRETARFFIYEKTVKPIAYIHKGRDKVYINYDWDKNLVVTNDDGNVKEFELMGGELDLLTLQMQLMQDLKSDKLQSEYTVIKGNDRKTYSITKLAEETIKLGDTEYATVKLKQKRDGSSRHTHMWLARDLQYAVLKMEQYKGEKLRGTLSMTSYKLAE